MEFGEPEKLEHLKYLVQLVLPFLRRLNDEQMKELELEAKIQGMFDCSMLDAIFKFLISSVVFEVDMVIALL